MDIKQKIEDNTRLQKDSRDKHKHWKKRHEELELVYVEYAHFACGICRADKIARMTKKRKKRPKRQQTSLTMPRVR